MPTISKVLITEQTLKDLAAKIRGKTGKTDKLTPSEMIEEIDDIGGLDWSVLGYSGTPEWLTEEYNKSLELKALTTGQQIKSFLNNNENRYSVLIYDNPTPQYQNAGYDFANMFSLKEIINIDISSEVTSSSSSNLFNGDTALTNIKNIEQKRNYKINSCSSMFYECRNLKAVPLFDTSNVTNMGNMFHTCTKLKSVPLFNTSNVTSMYQMFYTCTKLETVPLFNTSNVTNMTAMFYRCLNLTDESLDNILQMCINSKITSSKTLTQLGFNPSVTEMAQAYPVSRIEALPHYQDFLDAGWTIGY